MEGYSWSWDEVSRLELDFRVQRQFSSFVCCVTLLQHPSFCFLSAKQMYSHPLSRVVVTSAGHCAGVNSRVFTPAILTTALRGGSYSYPHFPDGDTEAQQLAQGHLASGRVGTG